MSENVVTAEDIAEIIEYVQAADGGGEAAYNVTIFGIGEEAEWLVAFGHHEPRQFLAACNRFARRTDGDGIFGEMAVTYSSARREVVHDMCRLAYDGVHFELSWCSQEPNRTIPITRLARW